MVGGARLSAKITTVMTDNAALVRMSRYTTPCNGSEVIDTTTDGIDNTRVAMRKPRVRLSDVAVEAFRDKSAHAGSFIGSTYRSARGRSNDYERKHEQRG